MTVEMAARRDGAIQRFNGIFTINQKYGGMYVRTVDDGSSPEDHCTLSPDIRASGNNPISPSSSSFIYR